MYLFVCMHSKVSGVCCLMNQLSHPVYQARGVHISDVMRVAFGQVSYSSDVFSVAIIFAELLCGKRGLAWTGCASAKQRQSFLFKQWMKTK